MMLPLSVLNQYAAFARRPAGKIAERSLAEIPITFDRSPSARRNSSPTVEHNRRRGPFPFSLGLPASIMVLSSVIDLTFLPVSRSYHSLATIPVCEGEAPVINTAWPGAVNVGT